MTDVWSANIIAQLHMIGMTQKDFAKHCGYTAPYMSMLLRGHKDTSQAREKIESVLKKIKQEKEIYI